MALATLLVVAGVATARSSILLLAAVGVVYACYARVTIPPSPSLSIDRHFDDPRPADGDRVTVTVTVENTGDRRLPDVRFVDGVPETLAVLEGSPRRGLSLRPGRSTNFSYVLEAHTGRHRFEPATVVARDLAGTREAETTVATRDELVCSPVSAAPAPSNGRRIGGAITGGRGDGVEFHRLREYRRGDPIRRVDWRHYARTGALATVEFREERTVPVVALVDAREPSYRGRTGAPTAVGLSCAVAEAVLESLAEARIQVGLAGVGRTSCWLAPAVGEEHVVRARHLLATHPTFDPSALEDAVGSDLEGTNLDQQLAVLRRRLTSSTQVVVCTPLCDDGAVRAARTLSAAGHVVTVLSPDVTTSETAGGRLARVDRTRRIATLRSAGIAVVDWRPPAPLPQAIDVAGEVIAFG